MTITRTIRNVLALAALSLTLPACTSTDLLYDAEGNPPSDEIVLSISMPEDALLTRAGEIPHEGHTLRYTAKLFDTDGSNGSLELVGIKQALATDPNVETILSFEAKKGKTYRAYVFADYLPDEEASKQNSETGLFPNYYYDVTRNDEDIDMIAFTKDGGHTSCGYNPINNDNYDCFVFKTGDFKKGEEKKEFETKDKMKRAISKVRFVNSFKTDKTVESITFSKFDYLSQYKLKDGGASVHKNTNLVLSAATLNALSDEANNEFFYFYTFAGPDANDSYNNLYDFEFTVKFNDETSLKTTVASGKINVRCNYITTVKGAFTPLPGPTPDDFIYFHITTDTNQNWNSPDQTTDLTK